MVHLWFQRGLVAVVIGLMAGVVFSAGAAEPAEVSFCNDVMPVLAKAGCNLGTCHGNKYGKGGFKLSLRGQDPGTDHATITREMFGRRINAVNPDESLVLLKATTQLAHEGGLRFRKDSAEYEVLRRWIAAGMPDDTGAAPKLVRLEASPSERVLVEPEDKVQLKVEATFADGSHRDVTKVAVYETANTLVSVSHDGLAKREGTGESTVLVRFLDQQLPVRLAFIPARPDFAWKKVPANNYIDEQVFAKLRSLRMNPSELCTDSEFVRRAQLDLLGLLPTAEEARAFVADKHRDKRAKLIDQLIERPEFADFWALKWADLLRNEEKALDRKGVQDFYHWIRQSLAENKPLDQFVREIIAARGSTYSNPAANFYRSLRDPVTRAESSAQVFLGIRLQCAQCHNHPFDRWTQDDYYNWTTLFSRVQYKVLENNKLDGLDSHEFIGEQIVCMAREGEVKNARTGKEATPRFLGAATPEFGDDRDRLEELATWVTSPNNPLFARSQANRIWFNLMGRGIVDPIDDFRPTNPPSHPALLEALTKDFVAHKFDLKYMVRLIMNSRAYQLSDEPVESNREDLVNYSHVIPRRLTAEQLIDAQHQVLGVPTKFSGYPVGLRAGQMPGVATTSRRRGPSSSSSDKFLVLFGKPQRLLTCECERSSETTLNQAFQLISGPAINELLSDPDNRLGRLVASGKPNREAVEELYWTALTRPPTAKELEKAVAYLEKAKDRRAGLEDVTWGLLNAKEFVLRK